MSDTFSIGADPEVFMGYEGKFVPANGLVPGTKLKPMRVIEGALQVDGMALEYNIDPCTTKDQFVHRIRDVKAQLEDFVQGLEVLETATVQFTQDDVRNVPPENFELGCGMDFNAYTGKDNPSPDGSNMLRTAGGHVHIGGFHTSRLSSRSHLDKCARLTRLMDRELGVPSLLWDKDTLRRSMYGKAGCFRPTYYGMEYRTLSNLWIFDDSLIEFVYEATKKSYDMFLDGEDVTTEKWRDIIDNSKFEEVPDEVQLSV